MKLMMRLAISFHRPLFFVIIYAVLTTACTKKFEEINTDPTQFTQLTPAIIPNAFAKAQYQGVYGDPGIYQLVRNLFVDYWSQYYATVDPSVPTDRYVLRADWVFYQWSSHYSSTWPTLKQVIDATEGKDIPANAIAKIWKAYVFHSTTDFYGPVPYFQAGNGELSIPYDSQESIYDDMLKTLDSAVTTLKTIDPALKPYGSNDLIYAGDIPKWIKLGNTLRLRLAMRISKVLPERARKDAEAAVASGVFTADDDNAFLDVATPSPNGLNLMGPWGGFRMSASMESYLKGFGDPRMKEYFSPAINDLQYHGARNGLSVEQIAASAKNQFDNLSNIGPRYDPEAAATNKLPVMYTSEAFFLRAEGAVNGWNMNGTAQQLYEQGIAASMRQWGITDNTVIQQYVQGTAAPIALNDYLNSPAVANIPVKFSSDPVVQRQQIATQKWLALFPDGIEAWAEIRRTGFPKLYPVANSDNPDLAPTDMIRRFRFIEGEYQTNSKAVQNALPLLGGPDKASTRVWWNK
jgi:SusD/RagB-like outer membrane lipoprotein